MLERDELTEYDEYLKPINRVQLPRGMSVSSRPGYEAELWKEITKSSCRIEETGVYELNGALKLILACDREVGFVDSRQQPVFSDRYYAPMHKVAGPVFSENGDRFVLQYLWDVTEPPDHDLISYLLYDLRKGRKIVFAPSPEDRANRSSPATGLSPDGTAFAIAGEDAADGVTEFKKRTYKLWMYSLPL